MDVRCAFLAFLCPSALVAKRMETVLAQLPRPFVAFHMRTFAFQRGSEKGQRLKGESDFLLALDGSIPKAPTAQTLEDHARHVDRVLEARCASLVSERASASMNTTGTNSTLPFCACATRFETQLAAGRRLCAACSPSFFSSDLGSLVEYVQRFMTQWLVVAGAPYHFVSDRKARAHSFPVPRSERLEDAKIDTWATFLVMTQAQWTVATLESDFSKLPTAHGRGERPQADTLKVVR